MASNADAVCGMIVVLFFVMIGIITFFKLLRYAGYLGQYRAGTAMKKISQDGLTVNQGIQYPQYIPYPQQQYPAQQPYSQSQPMNNNRIFCGNCGSSIDANNRFCPRCGTEITQPRKIKVQ